MATIRKKGDSVRHGAVKKRSQVYNPGSDRFVKIDEETGLFLDMKADSAPFAGVRKSKKTKRKAKAGKKKGAKKRAAKKKKGGKKR